MNGKVAIRLSFGSILGDLAGPSRASKGSDLAISVVVGSMRWNIIVELIRMRAGDIYQRLCLGILNDTEISYTCFSACAFVDHH
jgi:hypothetical protein